MLSEKSTDPGMSFITFITAWRQSISSKVPFSCVMFLICQTALHTRYSHSLDMPTSRHFCSRQDWHRFLVSLFMTQTLSRWHVYTMFFWMLLRKKPWSGGKWIKIQKQGNKNTTQHRKHVHVLFSTPAMTTRMTWEDHCFVGQREPGHPRGRCEGCDLFAETLSTHSVVSFSL